MEKKNTIAERFRAVRKQLGLTQQELADRMLLTRNYVAKIETGKKVPSARIVSALESLRVDREYKQAGDRWTVSEGDRVNSEALEAEMRELFEQTLAAARGNDRHLIWMAEQMRVHLRPPAHWLTPQPPHEGSSDPSENPSVKAARESGRRKGFAKAAEILASQQAGSPSEKERTG